MFISSFILSQECGNNICSETENYISCIDDCPIAVNDLFWFEDISVHVDSASVLISLNSQYLENLIAIQFEIQYDDNVLELNIDNCNLDNNIDCEITNSNLTYLTNSSNSGIIEGIIYSGMFFDIEDELINIKFNIIGLIGDYSNITFNRLEVNDIDVMDYAQGGLITIGNFGCMDNGACTIENCGFNSPYLGTAACNYSSEATFHDDSCEYEYDCFDICGGLAIEDCFGQCGGNAIEDCLGECGGLAEIDECDVCNGDGVPDDECDCDGTLPTVYCYDVDGDGLGGADLDIPDYPFEICGTNDNDDLVSNCSDLDDSCPLNEDIDDCGECGGTGPNVTTNCCSNTNLSIAGLAPDDCGECGGNIFMDNNGFHPDGTCGCEGMLPMNYCTDINNDGISDSDPFSFCYEPSSDIFIDCETLGFNDVKINDYKLVSVYPNPFNPFITIDYNIKKTGFISIKILDLNGRYISTLLSNIEIQGKHSINWKPNKKTSSGIYLLEIKHDNQIFIQKINYIK